MHGLVGTVQTCFLRQNSQLIVKLMFLLDMSTGNVSGQMQFWFEHSQIVTSCSTISIRKQSHFSINTSNITVTCNMKLRMDNLSDHLSNLLADCYFVMLYGFFLHFQEMFGKL